MGVDGHGYRVTGPKTLQFLKRAAVNVAIAL